MEDYNVILLNNKCFFYNVIRIYSHRDEDSPRKSNLMSLISQIILLQEVDNKLFEIKKLLGDLPSKVEELTEKEDGFKLSLENKENELKETSVSISSNETLVDTTSEKINTLKDKLIDGSISTNKEYDAMMETIDFEKNLSSEKENELIMVL